MYKLGIIGYPLGHSLSAVIQKAAFDSMNVDATYEILETPPENLIDRIKFLKRNDFNGFNVTIPLKVPVSLFVNEIDDDANIAGCVNTVKIMENKEFYGYNTDIYGFMSAIPKDVDLSAKCAAILGTGGASRAAAVGLVKKGVQEIDLYTRNIINYQNAINYLRNQFPAIKFEAKQIQNVRDVSKYAIIVNATPIGMRGFAMDESPLEFGVVKTAKPDTVVYDIVYNPIKTLLLQYAEKCGLRTVEGLDMLIYQAEKAINIWTGMSPDVKTMKIAALQAL